MNNSQVKFTIDAHHNTLQQLRKQKGENQTKCAKKVKISLITYRQIERCLRMPTEEEINRIAKHFNETPENLFPKQILEFSDKWGKIDKTYKEKIIESQDLLFSDIPQKYLLEAQLQTETIEFTGHMEELQKELNRKRIKKAILNNKQLSKKETEILFQWYGLLDEPNNFRQSLEEIGKTYGVTRERVRQLIAKANDKLRNPRNINPIDPEEVYRIKTYYDLINP